MKRGMYFRSKQARVKHRTKLEAEIKEIIPKIDEFIKELYKTDPSIEVEALWSQNYVTINLLSDKFKFTAAEQAYFKVTYTSKGKPRISMIKITDEGFVTILRTTDTIELILARLCKASHFLRKIANKKIAKQNVI